MRASLYCLLLTLSAAALGADVAWNTVDGGGATFSGSGTVKLGGTVGQSDAGTLQAGTVALMGGFWSTLNHPKLNAGSGAIGVSVSPAVVGAPVTFTSPVGGNGIVVTWNLGDGSPAATGASTVHTFASAGTFTVTATAVRIATGETMAFTVSVQASVAVVPPPGGGGGGTGGGGGGGGLNPLPGDADGDGFSDELETALGTIPTDKNSTPFGGAAAGAPAAMPLAKLQITLNMKKSGADSITLMGALAIPDGFRAAGQVLVADVGGAIQPFTLDDRGSSRAGNSSVKLGIKSKKGVVAAQSAKFTLSLKGSFAAKLSDEGLTAGADQKSGAATVRVTMLFNRQLLRTEEALEFTAKAGTSVRAK